MVMEDISKFKCAKRVLKEETEKEILLVYGNEVEQDNYYYKDATINKVLTSNEKSFKLKKMKT
jgi:hypothetical protein